MILSLYYENFANNNNSEDKEAGGWNEYIEEDKNYEETEGKSVVQR